MPPGMYARGPLPNDRPLPSPRCCGPAHRLRRHREALTGDGSREGREPAGDQGQDRGGPRRPATRGPASSRRPDSNRGPLHYEEGTSEERASTRGHVRARSPWKPTGSSAQVWTRVPAGSRADVPALYPSGTTDSSLGWNDGRRRTARLAIEGGVASSGAATSATPAMAASAAASTGKWFPVATITNTTKGG